MKAALLSACDGFERVGVFLSGLSIRFRLEPVYGEALAGLPCQADVVVVETWEEMMSKLKGPEAWTNQKMEAWYFTTGTWLRACIA